MNTKTELDNTYADPLHNRASWDVLLQIFDPLNEDSTYVNGRLHKAFVDIWLESHEIRGQSKQVIAVNIANLCTSLPNKPAVKGRFYVEVQVLYRDNDLCANDFQYYVSSLYFGFRHSISSKRPEEITPFDLVDVFWHSDSKLRRKVFRFLRLAGVKETRSSGEFVVVAHGSLSGV